MVVVLGTFDVDPADREAFMASRAAQVTASRAEAGNLEYAFSADALDPGRVRLTELWASETEFQAHVARISAERGPDGPVEVVPIVARTFATFHVAPVGS
jgi:quinol monooxygenase YgiN